MNMNNVNTNIRDIIVEKLKDDMEYALKSDVIDFNPYYKIRLILIINFTNLSFFIKVYYSNKNLRIRNASSVEK